MAKKMFVSFILDETGSMQAVKGPTISGFNEYIATLQAEKNVEDIRFTLTRFNSEKIEVTHDTVKLKDVDNLTEETYRPAALTPLYDAMGRTIRSLEKKLSGKKQNVLVVIQTDGMENHSREFTRQGIFELIREKKEQGWTFAFLGADQDAWAAGEQLGLDKGNVMSYASARTQQAFQSAARASANYVRSGGTRTEKFFEDES